MRTDPLTDTLTFLAAATGDQMAIGAWRWLMMAVFAALILGSIFVAIREWAIDERQRTGRDLSLWFARVLIGCMWFQNVFWKLPFLSVENGLYYWTGQEVEHAAFQFHRELVRDWLLPHFFILDIFVFLTELAFAVSLILGLGVRLVGVVGVLFVAQLWMGLYRHPQEWPWTYVFLAMLMSLFALLAAGRSLGLDASLRRAYPPDMTNGAAGTLLRAAT